MQCLETWTRIEAPPSKDDNGLYFVCPACGHRNPITDVSDGDDENPIFRQLDR